MSINRKKLRVQHPKINFTSRCKLVYSCLPLEVERGLKRLITVDGATDIWYKIAEGERINKLSDGTFIINDESYYIDFDASSGLKPFVRNSNGNDELLVKITENKQNFNYNIIW